MNGSHYIRLGLTVRGPYNVGELHELAKRGGFSKSHDVSTDKKSWTSASDHPELFPEARRSTALDRSQRQESSTGRPEPASLKSEDTSTQPAASNQPSISHPAAGGTKIAETSALQPNEKASSVHKLSGKAISTLGVGVSGFVLLMFCTAIVVMRLRSAPFIASANPGLIALLLIDAFLGTIALITGHLAVKQFHSKPGTVKERNLIVIGLSCGYTILILSVLYFIVLVMSAFLGDF